MRKNVRKILCVLLSILLVLSLSTGCGKKNDTSANDLNAEKERPEFTYTSNYTQLSSDDSNVGSFTYLNGKVYFLSYTWAYEEVVDEETGEYRTLDNSVYHINSMSADGSDFMRLAAVNSIHCRCNDSDDLIGDLIVQSGICRRL